MRERTPLENAVAATRRVGRVGGEKLRTYKPADARARDDGFRSSLTRLWFSGAQPFGGGDALRRPPRAAYPGAHCGSCAACILVERATPKSPPPPPSLRPRPRRRRRPLRRPGRIPAPTPTPRAPPTARSACTPPRAPPEAFSCPHVHHHLRPRRRPRRIVPTPEDGRRLRGPRVGSRARLRARRPPAAAPPRAPPLVFAPVATWSRRRCTGMRRPGALREWRRVPQRCGPGRAPPPPPPPPAAAVLDVSRKRALLSDSASARTSTRVTSVACGAG